MQKLRLKRDSNTWQDPRTRGSSLDVSLGPSDFEAHILLTPGVSLPEAPDLFYRLSQQMALSLSLTPLGSDLQFPIKTACPTFPQVPTQLLYTFPLYLIEGFITLLIHLKKKKKRKERKGWRHGSSYSAPAT
jgi:hypothetical protein